MGSSPNRRVVLTRPAERQADLADHLKQMGCDVLALPALRIEPLDSTWCVAAVRPGEFDLMVFVSRAAWHYYKQAVSTLGDTAAWPPTAVIAAVGQSTARRIRQQVPACVTVLCSSSVAAQDSESLWSLLAKRVQPGQRVLLVRAATGRDWLADQLRAAGASVTILPVYQRRALAWPAQGIEKLQAWRDDGLGGGVWVVTSLEGLRAVERQFARADLAGFRPSAVVVFHERLVEPARQWLGTLGLGGHRVPIEVTRPDDESLLKCLIAVLASLPGSPI